MGYQEFRDFIQKKGQKSYFKIRNSYGVYNAYKDIRKNKWFDIGRPLTEHEFYSIIRAINNILANDIANGVQITLPYKMGQLELRKSKRGVRLVKGKLKNSYPIDWDKTVKLWYEDREAKNNKILIRKESKYVYYIKYSKFKARYENQSFYEFALNRSIKLALKNNIKNNKIDALW